MEFNKIKTTNKLHTDAIFDVDVDSKLQRIFIFQSIREARKPKFIFSENENHF